VPSLSSGGRGDDVRDWLVEHLAHPDGVLVVDETGFLKRATTRSVYNASTPAPPDASKNSQVAVFLAYASPRGRGLIDRRIYLPQDAWCSQPARRTAAGVPERIRFATKPALAPQMIAAAIDADVPASWVTADEVYGADPHLRTHLEHSRIGYVLAVACDRRVAVNDGWSAATCHRRTRPSRPEPNELLVRR
jgi:SRSO17 transposase